MEKEKLQKLESIHVKLNFAYHNRNENVMKLLFKEFEYNYPEFGRLRLYNTHCVFTEHSLPSFNSINTIDNLFGVDLYCNIEGCLRTIESIFKENKYLTFSSHCIEVLYFPQKEFAPTDILYTVPIQHDNDEKPNTLKVSDLLSVAKYSLQVLDIIQPNEKTSDISDTITVMQSIDLALNNKPYDKPLNKSLHIVNSVLTSIVKRNLENESDKRLVSTMGLLIDLAIDFFTAKR